MEQKIIAELSYRLTEDDSKISFDLSHKSEIEDYLSVAMLLSETKRGRLALSILDAIEEFKREEIVMEQFTTT